MNEQENLKEVVRYWIEKAREALEAAQDEKVNQLIMKPRISQITQIF